MKISNNITNSGNSLFDSLVNSILESNLASAGGSFGSAPTIGNKGGAVGNNDFYARGDTRVPFPLITKRKRKRTKKDKEVVVVQRRPKIKM